MIIVINKIALLIQSIFLQISLSCNKSNVTIFIISTCRQLYTCERKHNQLLLMNLSIKNRMFYLRLKSDRIFH